MGHKFTLVTNHKPLVGMLAGNKSAPIMAAARIQRCALKLGAYLYRTEYKPGSQNGNADALSRPPLPDLEQASEGLHEHMSVGQLDATFLSAKKNQ